MRTRIDCSELYGMEDLPSELIGNVNNLMDSKEISFKDIDPNNIEAIADKLDLREVGMWEELNIWTNPLVHYRADFKSFNPNKSGHFFQIDLFTSNKVEIDRRTGRLYQIPSIRERLNGQKTTEEIVYRAFYKIHGQRSEQFSENSKVIPIYEGNSDYGKVMAYINLSKEARK